MDDFCNSARQSLLGASGSQSTAKVGTTLVEWLVQWKWKMWQSALPELEYGTSSLGPRYFFSSLK